MPGYGFGYSPLVRRFSSSVAPSPYGTLTTAWIAATGETDLTILGALNTLETDLTTYGLTAKMKALYPFVGGTAAKHKFNFMDAQDTDAAFRLVFNGGWTHSNTGALPNGTNGWVDTKLNNSTTLTQNSTHLSIYSITNNSNFITDISNDNGLLGGSPYLFVNFGGVTYIKVNQNTNSSVADTDSLGLRIASRINSTTEKIYKNNSLALTSALTSAFLSNGNMVIGKFYNNAYWSNREYALASIGLGLTDTEAANFYTAVQAFQTTLSRQV
jgi:hypothetical protein